MKRLVTLAATLLALTAVPFALASGGLGNFKTTLAGKGANTEHGRLDGAWAIDLGNRTSGALKLTWNGQLRGGGRYVISGSTITLTPKQGGKCKTKAKYTFKRSGNTLTFTPIRDTCATRRDVLTYGAWTRIA
jgi:hypothetical protein